MVSIFSFVFAMTAIAGMITFKNWELKAGKTVFREIRFKADRIVFSFFIFIKSHLPIRGKKFSKEIIHHSIFYFSHFALSGVKFLEKRLIRLINFIKGRGVIKKERNTSDYLKNVSKYERHPDKR